MEALLGLPGRYDIVPAGGLDLGGDVMVILLDIVIVVLLFYIGPGSVLLGLLLLLRDGLSLGAFWCIVFGVCVTLGGAVGLYRRERGFEE